MYNKIVTARHFVLLLFILSIYTLSYAQEIDMIRPAPEGVIVFAGMEIPNGKNVDHYLIERSENKKQWTELAKLKSPATWSEFEIQLNQYKQLFPFQEIPKAEKMQKLWENALKYGTIDSMQPWSGLSFIRLAAATG